MTATTQATSVVQVRATQPATPVLLQVARIAQRGTVAARDVQFVVTVTVANHTDAPIHLAGFLCQRSLARTSDGRLDNGAPSVTLELDDAPSHAIWQSWYWISCPLGTSKPVDSQTVAAGDTYTTTLTCDMSTGYVVVGAGLRAGTPYTVRASLVVWHQGTLAQLDQPGAPSGPGRHHRGLLHLQLALQIHPAG